MDLDEAQLDAEERMIKSATDYEHFLKTQRSGQASSEVLDNIQVDIPSFGGVSPLKSVAVIARQDAQMLTVKPFDPKTIKDIEKSLGIANLGLTITNDGKIIRLAFPPLSEERRKQTVKNLKERLEQQKVAIRNIRKEAIKAIEGNDGKAGVSEDMIAKAKEAINELTKQYETQMDAAFDKKSKEIMKI